MKKNLLIMLLVIITLMGRAYNIHQINEYKTEISQLKAENAELQDTVYELDSEIRLLVEDTDWWDLPVYDDTVDDPNEVDWASWDNLRD